jgi:hypothetical protein
MYRGLCQGNHFYQILFLITAGGLNVMLEISVASGLFKGYQVGYEATSVVHISRLQFVDDTLIVGEKSWTNIRVLKVNP